LFVRDDLLLGASLDAPQPLHRAFALRKEHPLAFGTLQSLPAERQLNDALPLVITGGARPLRIAARGYPETLHIEVITGSRSWAVTWCDYRSPESGVMQRPIFDHNRWMPSLKAWCMGASLRLFCFLFMPLFAIEHGNPLE